MVFSPWLGAVELAQGYPDAGEDVPHLVPMQRDQLSFPGRGFSANPPSPLPRGNWTVLHKQDCEFRSRAPSHWKHTPGLPQFCALLRATMEIWHKSVLRRCRFGGPTQGEGEAGVPEIRNPWGSSLGGDFGSVNILQLSIAVT